MDRNALITYLDTYLECKKFRDYAPNGLQIEGCATVNTICTAVSASEEAIVKARLLKAELLLVHHGYFWKGEPLTIQGMKKQRISLLLKENINLCAYHLPLDVHPVVGNNVTLATLLGLQDLQSFEAMDVANLLWLGEFQQPLSSAQLTERISHTLMREPIAIVAQDKPIKKLALCTGAAQDLIEQAYHLGADAYISGEISERTYYQAQELKMQYFACGHHATERYGIQALGQHVADTFKIKHHYIECANPI